MNARRPILRAIAIAILAIMTGSPLAGAASKRGRVEPRTERMRAQEGHAADQAVKQLWSPELMVRLGAKATLVGLGTNAVGPLVSLLEDPAANDHERYETGMEVLGPELRKVLEKQLRSADSNHRLALSRLLADLDISSRLERDACEILGGLHAVEAVPILATLSWSRMAVEIGLSFRTYLTSPSIDALVQIGRPAVALIVIELQNAESTASLAFRENRFGPKIKTREDLANYIRSTFANVLGQIGDERARPALESLSEKSEDSEVRFYCRQAISMLGAMRYRGWQEA